MLGQLTATLLVCELVVLLRVQFSSLSSCAVFKLSSHTETAFGLNHSRTAN